MPPLLTTNLITTVTLKDREKWMGSEEGTQERRAIVQVRNEGRKRG
jgi:hypothetical protein